MNEGTLLKRIVTDPKIMLGKPVIKGTRLTVELIVEKLPSAQLPNHLKKIILFLPTTISRLRFFMPQNDWPMKRFLPHR